MFSFKGVRKIDVSHTSNGTIAVYTAESDCMVGFVATTVDADVSNDTSRIFIDNSNQNGGDISLSQHSQTTPDQIFINNVAMCASGKVIRAQNENSGGQVIGTLYVWDVV